MIWLNNELIHNWLYNHGQTSEQWHHTGDIYTYIWLTIWTHRAIETQKYTKRVMFSDSQRTQTHTHIVRLSHSTHSASMGVELSAQSYIPKLKELLQLYFPFRHTLRLLVSDSTGSQIQSWIFTLSCFFLSSRQFTGAMVKIWWRNRLSYVSRLFGIFYGNCYFITYKLQNTERHFMF